MRTTVVFIEKFLRSAPSASHITLKEAARISGYSSDYIGQLIRSGKLPGKQIYSNVAWVTTEAALQKYIYDQENAATPNSFKSQTSKLTSWWRRTTLDGDRFVRFALWVAIAILSVTTLFFLYVGSVTLDKFLTQASLEKYETQHEIDPRFLEPVPFRIEGPPDG